MATQAAQSGLRRQRHSAGLSGVYLYDPHVTGFRSSEVDEEGSIERSAWSFEGDAMVRVVERFETAGTIERWVERWMLDASGNCFRASTDWGESPWAGRSYCRTDGGREGER